MGAAVLADSEKLLFETKAIGTLEGAIEMLEIAKNLEISSDLNVETSKISAAYVKISEFGIFAWSKAPVKNVRTGNPWVGETPWKVEGSGATRKIITGHAIVQQKCPH